MIRFVRTRVLPVAFSLAVLTVVGCDDDNPVGPDGGTEHADLDGVVVQLSDGTEILRQWEGAITGELTLPAGSSLDDLQVWFLDEDEDLVHPGEEGARVEVLARRDDHDDHDDHDHGDEEFELEVEVDDGSIASFEVHEDFVVDLDGLVAGETTVQFIVLHEGHADFTSLSLPLRVTAAP